MILEYNSKDANEVNNVKLLSVYETEAYFYYKNIYPGKLFLLIWPGVHFPKAIMVASSVVTNRVQWK